MPSQSGEGISVASDRGVDSIISSPCSPITLKFSDVGYRIKIEPGTGGNGVALGRLFCSESRTRHGAVEERTILSGITGVVTPGEILAILGPSGSGKSTLLNVLAGRLQGKFTGTVLANGQKVTRPVLRRTGFVTQDDILYPHLTVKETLVFCSLLRLPKTLSKKEKVRVVESVISELGLVKCENTIVGNAFIRGVSGGERKRVSIGHEMLLNPSLLLLDEPTSGLDSTAAHRLVATLSGLARKGKTIVTSMHQPSSRVYQMFDSVLLLSEGICLYFGEGRAAMDYFASIGFSSRFHVNPADFMLDLANGVGQVEGKGEMDKSVIKQSLASSFNGLLAPNLKALINSRSAAEDAIQKGSQRDGDGEQIRYDSISWFDQFTVLLQRSLKERRHEAFDSLRVFQVVAAAILAGTMWWHSSMHDVQDRLGLLFFISIFWGVFPSCNAVFTFPQERAIFVKEKSSGMYTLSSYFMARMAGDLPMELILPTVFAIISYWMAGLKPELGTFMLTLVVLLGYVLVAQGLGLALGAAIKDAKQALMVATVTMLAFLLAGGFYVHNVPSCMGWMKYASLTFYCYKLLIRLQYRGIEMVYPWGSYHQKSNVSNEMIERELDQNVSAVVSVTALVAMFVGYRLLAYMSLKRMKV